MLITLNSYSAHALFAFNLRVTAIQNKLFSTRLLTRFSLTSLSLNRDQFYHDRVASQLISSIQNRLLRTHIRNAAIQ